MINKIVTASLLLIASTFSKAQDATEKKGYKFDNNFDFSFSTAGNPSSMSLSWVKFHSITKKKRFKIGYGVRFNSQFGKDLYYITAPANLTAKPANIDTFFVNSPQNNSINLSINLQYTVKTNLDIGFNIDALGISFGGKTTGKYISNQSNLSGSVQSASPTPFNILLVGDNDIGMLNSEFYVRYWFNQKWAIRGGANFLFTEYTTSNKLRLDNNRWRNKALLGLVGITFSPFR